MPKEMEEFLKEFAELLDKYNIHIQVTPKGLWFNFHTKLFIESTKLDVMKIDKMLEDIKEKRG